MTAALSNKVLLRENTPRLSGVGLSDRSVNKKRILLICIAMKMKKGAKVIVKCRLLLY